MYINMNEILTFNGLNNNSRPKGSKVDKKKKENCRHEGQVS